MNMKRVQRIPDLVRNACSQQPQRIQTLRLNCLLCCAAAFGDIAQDHHMPNLFRTCSRGRRLRSNSVSDCCTTTAGVDASGYSFAGLHHERNHVKIDETILRIENFHVVTDWSAALSQRSPIETSNALIKPFADCFAHLETE